MIKPSFVFLTLLIMSNILSAGTYSGGSGWGNDPFRIATLSDLEELSSTSADWNCYFVQVADIDASSMASWNSGAGFSPIGENYNEFTGNYDGQNHTIDSLYINRPAAEHIGMFGYTKGGAEISNVRLTNVTVIGFHRVGGLVGLTWNSTVSNCYVSGDIEVIWITGGGLVGYNFWATVIKNCYTICDVTGGSGGAYLGGLVGINNTQINNCYAFGWVTSSENICGGLVGSNGGEINNCYTSTGVQAFDDVGGLV